MGHQPGVAAGAGHGVTDGVTSESLPTLRTNFMLLGSTDRPFDGASRLACMCYRPGTVMDAGLVLS